MQLAIEIRDSNCNVVSGLNNPPLVLVVTATNATPGPEKGTPIADSEGVYGTFSNSGLTWTVAAGQYRTNIFIDPINFTPGNKSKFCVNSKPFPNSNTRAIGEVCGPDVTMQ